MTIKKSNKRIFFRYLVSFVMTVVLASVTSKPVDADKQTITSYITSGNKKSTMKDYEGAIAELTADEQTITSYITSGNKKSKRGDYEGAISELTKAIEINSIYPLWQAHAYELRALNRLMLRGISDKKGICFDLRQASSLGMKSATTTFYELCDH